MYAEKIIKSSQEQAVASWVNYLNQVRLDRLTEALSQQEQNFKNAMGTLDSAFATIKTEIISRNRGGDKGMHGFIAEVAECGIGNARQQIEGKLPIYEWIDDNGPVDFTRTGQQIQQKFVQSGGHFSLRAVAMHFSKYPDYIGKGGIYQIPSDHYEKIQYYLSISEYDANRMPTSTSEFSLKQWKDVHDFFTNGEIPLERLEPSILSYNEVQKNVIPTTMEHEKENLSKTNQGKRDVAYQESKPSLEQGTKATLVSAGIEGGTAFCMAVAHKRKAGKQIQDFDATDWKEIAGISGKGTAKGGVRGASIYMLTNFTHTPAAVASAIVTASFSVAEQAHLFRTEQIDEQQFIENSELVCLDAAVSALSSFVGQALIPIPVIGAVIGNTIGTLMYQIAKDKFSEKEQALFKAHLQSLGDLDKSLVDEYRQYIEVLNSNFKIYMELLDYAFAPDVKMALQGSVNLAKQMGVPTEEILDSHKKITAYFMD